MECVLSLTKMFSFVSKTLYITKSKSFCGKIDIHWKLYVLYTDN